MGNPIIKLLVVAFLEIMKLTFSFVLLKNVGPENTFFVELSRAMRAIKLAKQYNWDNLWLESDFALVLNLLEIRFWFLES